MVFHEITSEAIDEAIDNSRDLDMKLVEAQEGRRILDRLVGYEVSPVLWRRVGGARSAGRVQSVATRLVVERERERMAFRSAAYWDLDGSLRRARHGVRRALVRARRQARRDRPRLRRRHRARSRPAPTSVHLARGRTPSRSRPARRRAVHRRVGRGEDVRRTPEAAVQDDDAAAGGRQQARFSAGRTMSVAQGLYERGLHHLHADRLGQLSEQAVDAARAQIVERFGQAYLPAAPRTYANKVKNAQEAHEAIRPPATASAPPSDVARRAAPATSSGSTS